MEELITIITIKQRNELYNSYRDEIFLINDLKIRTYGLNNVIIYKNLDREELNIFKQITLKYLNKNLNSKNFNKITNFEKQLIEHYKSYGDMSIKVNKSLVTDSALTIYLDIFTIILQKERG